MARPLRIEMADGLYHITVRGWKRRVIVDSDRDREDWLRLLDRVVTRSHWRVFSWVLISNHSTFFCALPSRTCQRECTIVPQRHQRAWRPERADILGLVQDHFGVESRDLQQIRRHGNDARVAAIYLIRRLTVEKVTALAHEFGGVSVAAISKLLSRAELRRQKDPQWNNLLEELERKCQCQPCSTKLKVKT